MAKKKVSHKSHASDIFSCSLKSLPGDLQVTAAQEAVQINPMNAPSLASLPGVFSALVFEPAHLALLTSRWWGKDGVKLTVSFLSQARAELRAKILSHANSWGEFANVQFTEVASNGQVRISLGQGGYWSYLGTDVLHIPKNQPTMNLQAFSLSTPDSEYKRVVRHEFGHTLGWPHEHLRKAIIDRLDPEKTIAYFQQTQGWSRQDVIQQVLTPLDETDLVATPVADLTSIMTYGLPAQITRDNIAIPGGSDIDANDRLLAAKVYPKASAPPPPTGDNLPTLLAVLDADGNVVARYRR